MKFEGQASSLVWRRSKWLLTLVLSGFCSSLLSVGECQAGSELNFSQTRSSAALANRIKLGIEFNPSHKVTLVARKTTSLADVDDRETSSVRLGYRYRTESGSSLFCDLRKSDESYFFESSGGAVRGTLALLESTRLTLGLDGSRRSYTLSQNEQFFQFATAVGIELDLNESVSIGLAYDRQAYAATGPQLRRALQGTTVASNDINSYVGTLLASSISGFIEYAPWDWLTVGMGQSLDSYATITGQTETTEAFVDTQVTPSFTLGLYFSRGRSDFSTTLSDSYGGGITYGF